MTQRPLFTDDAPALSVAPVIPVNASVHSHERKRLQRQCLLLLEEFRQRDLSNRDIVALGILNGSGRISELRQAGFTVAIVERNHVTGRVVYHLSEPAA